MEPRLISSMHGSHPDLNDTRRSAAREMRDRARRVILDRGIILREKIARHARFLQVLVYPENTWLARLEQSWAGGGEEREDVATIWQVRQVFLERKRKKGKKEKRKSRGSIDRASFARHARRTIRRRLILSDDLPMTANDELANRSWANRARHGVSARLLHDCYSFRSRVSAYIV